MKRARYWIEWLLVSFFARIIPLIPLPLLRLISEFAAWLVFLLDKKSRAVAVANLEATCGSELAPHRRYFIARQSLQAFGMNILEVFWIPRFTTHNVEKYITAEDPERLRHVIESKTPFIAITPHFGNVELTGAFVGLMGRNLMIVAQPLKNDRLTPIFRNLREASGHKVVFPENAAVRLLKALRNGTSVFLLTDLFYSNHSLQFDLEIESQEHPERAKLLGEQIREYGRWRRDND